MIDPARRLNSGRLVSDVAGQIDLADRFEISARVPISTYRLCGKTGGMFHKPEVLRFTPNAPIANAPPPDVLHIPGGFGQEPLMEDPARRSAALRDC